MVSLAVTGFLMYFQNVEWLMTTSYNDNHIAALCYIKCYQKLPSFFICRQGKVYILVWIRAQWRATLK